MNWLLYFGRLEKEKWFDAILGMIDLFSKKSDQLPFELFIFGSWTYQSQIQDLAAKYKSIHYFWRQDLTTIKQYVSNCQYLLAPSTCLESFGLTALCWLSRWLKPIGYAKWWLAQFIDPRLDLNQSKWNNTTQKLFNLINKISQDNFNPTFDLPNLSNYSISSRQTNFAELIWPGKKRILIISDYINRVWWIETYINDAKDILNWMWYEVQLFWTKIPWGVFWKIIRYLWFFASIFNIYEAIRLFILIKKFKPDLLWYNSILRYLGRLSLFTDKFFKTQKWLMCHDLGYFYPFPKSLIQESQIKLPLNLRNYISSAKTKNPIKILWMIWKYISIYLIRKQSKKMDKILIPSQFMIEIVHQSYKIPKNKIHHFPHFIQN